MRDAGRPEGKRSGSRLECLVANPELILTRQHGNALVFPAVPVEWWSASGLGLLPLKGVGPARIGTDHHGSHVIAQYVQDIARAGSQRLIFAE